MGWCLNPHASTKAALQICMSRTEWFGGEKETRCPPRQRQRRAAGHPGSVPLLFLDRPLGHVPEPYGLVRTSARQGLAVRRKSEGQDDSVVPFQRVRQLPRLGVPEFYRPVNGSARDPLAVRGKGDVPQ